MFIQVIDHGSIVSCSHRWKYCTASGSCVRKKDWGELICHLGGCDTKTVCGCIIIVTNGCIIIVTNVTTTAATATMPHVSAVQTAVIALVSVQIRVRAVVVRAAAVATAVRVGPVSVQIRVRAAVVRAAAVATAVRVGPVSVQIRVRAVVVRAAAVATAVRVGPVSVATAVRVGPVSVQIRVRAVVVRAAAVATAVRVGPVSVQIRVRAVVVRAAAVATAVRVGRVSAQKRITTTTIVYNAIQMILTQTIAFWPFKDVVVPTDCVWWSCDDKSSHRPREKGAARAWSMARAPKQMCSVLVARGCLFLAFFISFFCFSLSLYTPVQMQLKSWKESAETMTGNVAHPIIHS